MISYMTFPIIEFRGDQKMTGLPADQPYLIYENSAGSAPVLLMWLCRSATGAPRAPANKNEQIFLKSMLHTIIYDIRCLLEDGSGWLKTNSNSATTKANI